MIFWRRCGVEYSNRFSLLFLSEIFYFFSVPPFESALDSPFFVLVLNRLLLSSPDYIKKSRLNKRIRVERTLQVLNQPKREILIGRPEPVNDDQHLLVAPRNNNNSSDPQISATTILFYTVWRLPILTRVNFRVYRSLVSTTTF